MPKDRGAEEHSMNHPPEVDAWIENLDTADRDLY